jgi:uncharacterized protein YegP (UPF0339 family)
MEAILVGSGDKFGQAVLMPEAKSDWYKDRAGNIMLRIVTHNGQTIAVGEGYEARALAYEGARHLKIGLIFVPIAFIVGVRNSDHV